MTRRKRGRPYQPYPERRTNWTARLLVVILGVALLVTIVAFAFTR